MNPHGPIIIIEDDKEETDLLLEIISELHFKNPVSIIAKSCDALEFLRHAPDPFIIFSGINLCGLNGFQIRTAILQDEELNSKCTPYIFYSAHATKETQRSVESCKAQGYLHDITDYNQLQTELGDVMDHWQKLSTPASA